jgi:mannose-6-phosphate isomerase-like protein (cupin superfamily)
MRRVVTGQKNEKSVILDDANVPSGDVWGLEVTGLWETANIPRVPLENLDGIKQFHFQFPKPEGTVFWIWSFPPDKELFKKAKEKGTDLEKEWRNLFKDDYGMHATDTVDYDYILSGEIWLEVDDGTEVHLKAGDCVVQNGNRHAWRNKSTKNCLMLCCLVGAKRKKNV